MSLKTWLPAIAVGLFTVGAQAGDTLPSGYTAVEYLKAQNPNSQTEVDCYIDTLMRSYTPCKRDSDDVLGLYESVNGEFLTNCGTGTFTTASELDDSDTVPVGYTKIVDSKPTEAHRYVVYGTLEFTNARDVLNYDGASVTVKDGGVFNLGISGGENYGNYTGFFLHQNATVTIEAGGTMIETKERCIGSDAQGLLHIDGGTLQMKPTSNNHEDYFRNLKLSNGATITGGYAGVGWCQESWSDRNGNMGTIVVDGTSASTIATTTFGLGGGRTGSYAGVINANGKVNNAMGARITVNDVTSCDVSDLVISGLVTTYSDYQDWPADKLYLEKLGAGTLELAGGIQAVPGVKLGEGTLKLGATTGNTVGKITVTGDAVFAAEDGADITFTEFEIASGKTLNIVADLDETAIYVPALSADTLAAIKLNDVSDSVAVENGKLVSTVAKTAPLISDFSVTVSSVTTVNASVAVTTIGEGATSCDLYIAYGTAANALGAPQKIGTGTASPIIGSFTAPQEGTTYFYELYLQNNLGEASKVKSGSFRAAGETASVGAPVWYSGLQQGKLNIANDFSTDFIANAVDPVEIVPGVVMALYVVGSGQQGSIFYTNPYTGSQYKWNGENTTFGYLGQIYLTEGTVITFGKNVDDSGLIRIGDTTVLSDTAWGNFPVASYTAPSTGWFDIEVRIGDGNGGKGVTNASKFGGFGIAYNTDGITSADASGWAFLEDANHDMSFLRTAVSGTDLLQMGSVSVDDGDVTVWISANELPAAAELVVYYGAADAGETVVGWTGSQKLADVGTDGMLATKFTIEGLGNYGAARFALVAPGSATEQCFAQFSAAQLFGQVDPAGTISIVGEPAATSVAASAQVEALGLNAASAELWVEVATDSAFTNPTATKIADLAIARTLAFDITDLVKNTDYWARLYIVNSNGGEFRSQAVSFTTFNPDIAHEGDTLVWNGGASGTWDTTSLNWLTPNGIAVAWVDNCYAVFESSAVVTLVDDVVPISLHIRIGNVSLDGAALAYNGALTVNAGTSLSLGVDAALGVDGLFSGALTIDGSFTYASATPTEFTGTCTGASTGFIVVGAAADVTLTNEKKSPRMDVYGKVTMKTISALQHDAIVDIKEGGVVYLDSNGNYAGGVSGNQTNYLKVEGTLIPIRGAMLGNDRLIWVDGGTVTNAVNDTLNGTYITSPRYLRLSNGGQVTGEIFACGGESWGPLSAYITVDGESPSFINSTYFRNGYISTSDEAGRFDGGTFTVEDVTGDDNADLIVNAQFVQPSNLSGSNSYGLVKTGAGTMEFRNRVAYCGITRVQQGTLRLAGTALFEEGVSTVEAACGPTSVSFEGGAIDLNGTRGSVFGTMTVTADSELRLGDRGTAVFTDSSETVWTEDATLVISGRVRTNAIRVGTAATLTDDQLAQIKYRTASGMLCKVGQNADGYLELPGDCTVILFR